ncbi:uncharacterized protein CEXT_530381 [Caerostris extrusa]|uniref:CWH43-like N-terminal domain-containing protein n=1 Tax=Caerostris extrusa TaxID=172846 RepID=A0AAV4M432_CAEEX|nr:uncharacterized protein CEXT_530381 [Caerostris extrusa]
MDGKGNDALLKTTKVTEWSVNNGGYISLAFGGLLLLGCILAYIIAVARGNVEAVLPLISDAAGSPPQNGLFGTIVSMGGMCGYPVNFYRNRDVWLMDVGLPHMIGGVMLLALGLLYIALQCILTLFLKSKNETVLSLRVLLVFICTAAFVYHMITVPENFSGISHLYYLNNTDDHLNYTGILPYPPTMGASLKVPIDTSGSYVASAIAQWVFVVFFCFFFFTFFHEAQEYSMLIVIETHTPQEPEAEDTKPDFRKISLHQAHNGSQGDTKPPPEVRKVLRRDSTCQTMTNALDDANKSIKATSMKPAKVDGMNNTDNVLSSAEVDAKLTRLLSECDTKNETKLEKHSAEQNVSTSCEDLIASNGNAKSLKEDADKEEEMKAIEKIDVVVKDAEDAATDPIKLTHKEDNSYDSRKNDTEEAQPSTCPLSVQ